MPRGQGTKKPSSVSSLLVFLPLVQVNCLSIFLRFVTVTTTIIIHHDHNYHDYNNIIIIDNNKQQPHRRPSSTIADDHQSTTCDNNTRIGPIHETPLGDLQLTKIHYWTFGTYTKENGHLAGATSTLFARNPRQSESDNT